MTFDATHRASRMPRTMAVLTARPKLKELSPARFMTVSQPKRVSLDRRDVITGRLTVIESSDSTLCRAWSHDLCFLSLREALRCKYFEPCRVN